MVLHSVRGQCNTKKSSLALSLHPKIKYSAGLESVMCLGKIVFLQNSDAPIFLLCYPLIRDNKTSPFVKFEIIPLLFCYSLDPLTNKNRMAWSSMINLVDRFQDLLKEPYCDQGEGLIITYSFQEKMFRGI